MNTVKSKVMVFERREVEVVNFSTQYAVSEPTVGRCDVLLGGEKMEILKEFKYLRTVLRKNMEKWKEK